MIKQGFILIIFTLIISTFGCSQTQKNVDVEVDSLNLIQYVNPLIGTQNMGHTFPGVCTPFGMVQLSPDTKQEPLHIDGEYNRETYRYCSGYQYDDSTIYGFSHTHFSGTGHSDLGDFLLMPTIGKLQLDPGPENDTANGFVSKFDHKNEQAEPGYYRVELDDYKILAELTATERVGIHRYTFPKTDSAHIILDLMAGIYNYEDKNVWTFVRVENDSLITGYRQTNGWARTRKVYFAMEFSKPFKSYGHKKYEHVAYNGFYRRFDEENNFPEMAGKQLRAFFNFEMEENEQLLVKFALSPTGIDGAMLNLKEEAGDKDFDKIKTETQAKWEETLSRIMIKTGDRSTLESFYTALYHTQMAPMVYEDVDGKYLGLDQNIHESSGFVNYSIFSLWDTYRAQHPLLNLFFPTRNNDMIHSMLAHQAQSVHNMLPIWSHYANENWCMIGYHAVSVIADAVAKGTTNVDLQKALEACVKTSNVPYFDGIDHYVKNGFVAEDLSSNSVSKTLEFAYDDWCIAQIAKKGGEQKIYQEYMLRAEHYKNVFNPSTEYMQPKLADGSWKGGFDPLDTHGQGFIEGNAWNYGLYVPQDIDNMIAMMGGKEAFSLHLDQIFNTPIEDKYIEKNEDITRDGIIGNYVHGNEPGHHIPYLYNWTGKAWKTQERVRMIMDSMYGNGPDGLCGNDDAGQMSAWYVFSALGFYPVLPGSTKYNIGSPLIDEAILYFENKNHLSIKALNQSDTNIYIEKVELNGKLIEDYTLDHFDLVKGGTLNFYMTDKAKKQ